MSTALILSSKSNQQPQNELFKSTEKYTKNYLYVHKKKKKPWGFYERQVWCGSIVQNPEKSKQSQTPLEG